MPEITHSNRTTSKKLGIIKRVGNMLHVQYESGMKAWYHLDDFERLFEPIIDELKK